MDVGGTFTDLIAYDGLSGEVIVAKGPSTSTSPEIGVIEVVSMALPPKLLGTASLFLHGTTVGLNTLLERKGAVVGLLTTRGFRDVLETRRGDRDAMYDVLWKAPPLLVERRLRLPVTERILAYGSIEIPFEETDVRDAVEIFKQEGVESVAVVFINSYTNPEHELAAAEALRKFGFEREISLSHQISGEYREYERTTTTVVDAYVRPRVSNYLHRLETALRQHGFDGQCLVTRSGGGAMTFQEAETRPFETIMSGPVSGAVGAGRLCRELAIEQAITADVGGTSFDTCLIVDGHPEVKYEGRVGGMPLQTTWVDVRSIGAGGGSLAYVDAGGLLRVGPHSAGAEPGPACYGRGGTEPTVTDAAAVLGMLASGELAGGVTLDIELAEAALRPLATQLSLDTEGVARGILVIATSAMANAIRSVTVEQGQDPRLATLIVFGGAGPLFGTLLARELDISTILIPAYAGNFSAWGLLGQDITRSAALTSIHRLDERGVEAANVAFQSLIKRLATPGGAIGASHAKHEVVSPALDLRYIGQESTLTIVPPVEDGKLLSDPQGIEDIFLRDYQRTFDHTLNEPIEIVSVRATSRLPLAGEVRPQVWDDEKNSTPMRASIDAYSFSRDKWSSFPVLDRSSLSAGSLLEGPAIVVEATATTYVDYGFELNVHPSGALLARDLGVS